MNLSSQKKSMKESVLELILFAVETKLKSRTLQLIKFFLASYPSFNILHFSWLKLHGKSGTKSFFHKMNNINMEYFRSYFYFCGQVCLTRYMVCYFEKYWRTVLSIEFVTVLRIYLWQWLSLENNRLWILWSPFSEMALKICGFLLVWH